MKSQFADESMSINHFKVMGLRIVASFMLVSKSMKMTLSYILLNLFTLSSSTKSFFERNTIPIISLCYQDLCISFKHCSHFSGLSHGIHAKSGGELVNE